MIPDVTATSSGANLILATARLDMLLKEHQAPEA
jgi:hypothetical protein